jgi:integrase
MSKFHPENEAIKRRYAFRLEAAFGKQPSTVDAALKAIERFEMSTGYKPFRKFHLEQVRSFRTMLSEETNANGRPLSAASVASTLRRLRDFFLWLSQEPRFRSRINPNDVQHFKPSDQDRRIAHARREKHVPSLEDIKLVLALMPSESDIELRDRAVVAFTLLTGARDGAISSFRLKHLSLEKESLFQDAREVRTKNRKSFVSYFFPVGPEPLEIVSHYVARLKELGFGPDDPLFPATQIKHDPHRGFAATGLSRDMWRTAEPIRAIFRKAFDHAGLPYSNPHSFRNTLVRLGERLCHTPEAWKAWSQNLGHESEATTFVGYGQVPGSRQAQLLRDLAVQTERRPEHLEIVVKAFLSQLGVAI